MATPLAETMPLAADVMDRAGHIRSDPETLAAAVAHPEARVLVVTGDLHVQIEGDGLVWRAVADDLDPAGLVFLGEIDGAPRFAVDRGDRVDLAADPVGVAVPVREAIGEIEGPEAAALLQATGLVAWHRRHPFCAVCGASSQAEEGGHVRRCRSCGSTHFPRTDPAVIMLVTAGDRCVLGQRMGAPSNRWSSLAGYVEPGESLEAAVAREVFEEVGLVVDSTTYVGSQPWPFPASLMVAYEATAPYGELTINEEHFAVAWFEREELRRSLESGAVAVPGRIAAGGYLIRRWLASTGGELSKER